jgi:hypothetical protein
MLKNLKMSAAGSALYDRRCMVLILCATIKQGFGYQAMALLNRPLEEPTMKTHKFQNTSQTQNLVIKRPWSLSVWCEHTHGLIIVQVQTFC